MATLTHMDGILKEDYKDYVEQLNQACFILAQVDTKTDTIEGRRAVHSIHTGRSGGVGARREGVALPTADRQRHKAVYVPLRHQFGRIELSVQLINQATGGSASFADAMENEMSGIRNDVMRDTCRQAWGTSNGVIATCGTTSSSTTITLASTTTEAQMRHLYENRVIDVGTVASPTTVASARTITAFSVASKTITISGAAISTTSGTHFVFNSSSGGASDGTGNVDDGQSELTGLQHIVDSSGVLHTLDPSTYSVWVAQEYGNSGTNRSLSETMVTQAILQNSIASGGSIDALASNVGVGIVAQQILAAYNRNVDTVDFKGGFKGLKWSTPGISGSGAKEVGWFMDFDAPANSIYGLNFDSLTLYQDGTWNWLDADGAVLSRVSGYAAYEATLMATMELACKQRNANFKITDLTESTL